MLKPIHAIYMGIFIHDLKLSQQYNDYGNQCDSSARNLYKLTQVVWKLYPLLKPSTVLQHSKDFKYYAKCFRSQSHDYF